MTKKDEKFRNEDGQNQQKLIELLEFVLVTFMPSKENAVQKLCNERFIWLTVSEDLSVWEGCRVLGDRNMWQRLLMEQQVKKQRNYWQAKYTETNLQRLAPS